MEDRRWMYVIAGTLWMRVGWVGACWCRQLESLEPGQPGQLGGAIWMQMMGGFKMMMLRCEEEGRAQKVSIIF
jgi:hypothetical protein